MSRQVVVEIVSLHREEKTTIVFLARLPKGGGAIVVTAASASPSASQKVKVLC